MIGPLIYVAKAQPRRANRKERKVTVFFSIDGNATMLIMVTALTTFSMYVSNGQALCHVNLPYLFQEERIDWKMFPRLSTTIQH